jgi:hypothetical protein
VALLLRGRVLRRRARLMRDELLSGRLVPWLSLERGGCTAGLSWSF